MSGNDADAIKAAIETCELCLPAERPRLLFGSEHVEEIRLRAAKRDGMLERVEQRCRALLDTDADTVPHARLSLASAMEAQTMAEGYLLLLHEEEFAEWAKRRVAALLALDTWIAPVHVPSRCDHVVTNVAASIALTHDFLGDAYSQSETGELAQQLRQMHFLLFLDAIRDRKEWWAKEDCESNWKIMCCGESGFAICGFAEHWPEAREALGLAAEGVIEVLDMVPPEGDWPEGVNYWFTTLRMGLRFATALRRATRGKVDLYRHPALAVTGDFAMMLTTPAEHVFNFNDNHDQLNTMAAEGLMMLATEVGRRDWVGIARESPAETVAFLAFDDPEMPSRQPEDTTGIFPRTGVVTMRSGWDPGDTFVGFKCGPSDVGHSHLDAASFVVESGGEKLIIDSGYWPYAHFLGFFDDAKLRWNWDNLTTVGHNCILVDGQGQTWGAEHAGRLVSGSIADDWGLAAGDAAAAYPGLLRKSVRSILFLHPNVIVVRDVIECEGERHIEWLLHYAGSIRSEGVVSVVENKGVRLTVTPFLPDRSFGWRVGDVVRTSAYENSNTHEEETRSVRYRSFAPFRAAKSFEFLFGLRIGDGPSDGDWEFVPADDGWTLRAAGFDRPILPEDDTMCLGSG